VLSQVCSNECLPKLSVRNFYFSWIRCPFQFHLSVGTMVAHRCESSPLMHRDRRHSGTFVDQRKSNCNMYDDRSIACSSRAHEGRTTQRIPYATRRRAEQEYWNIGRNWRAICKEDGRNGSEEELFWSQLSQENLWLNFWLPKDLTHYVLQWSQCMQEGKRHQVLKLNHGIDAYL